MEREGERGFWLYDLRVETVLDGRTPVRRHVEGEYFRVIGESLVFEGVQMISMYALAAVLPLLPARQRETDPDDWMSTDAAEHGRTMDPRRLRLVAPFHIAETRDKARENVRFGMQAYVDYINNNMPRFNVPPGEDIVDYWMRVKIGVVGTPDDAIAQIRKLQAKQGEFGVMLHMANNRF